MLRCASCLVPNLSRVRYGTISARRRHCCSRPVRGVRGRFVWRIRKHELTRRSVHWEISVKVSERDRESRSREVSARLRMREKFVAGMWSREFCHVQHVGTRQICHSDHMYFSPVQQTTTLQLAAYCVHCFLRQCTRVLTMAPPKPPSSFVSQGLRGQRLVGWPFGGVRVWHSLTFLTSGAVLWKGREAMASAPRKGAHSAAEASPSGPRRVYNRGPRGPK